MKSESSDWKYRLVIGALRAVAHLPLWMMYVVSDIAYFILYYVGRYRRKVVMDNLRKVYPDASERELKSIARRFYRHLCDVFVESVKLLHISDKEMARRVDIHGAELVDKYVNAGRSVVLLLGHYGNWEWVTSIVAKFNNDAIPSQIYHPLHNKVMDRVMLTIRSRFHSENVPMKHAARYLMGVERDGGKFVCGFISDQRPFGHVANHWTDFMGLDTPYVTGGEQIGNHVGAAYLYVDMEATKRGHYRLTFKEIVPPDSDKEPFAVTRQYLRMLEASIRRDPSQWLWSHKRWSRKRVKPEDKSSGV